jgi:hypothetical protein
MASMRAVFVLATILCLAAPSVSWGARAADPSSAGAISISLAAPATAASQIARAVAKADKTFHFGSAIAAHAPSILLPAGSIELIPRQLPEPPNVDLEGPPLAPRPPPRSS